MVVKEDGSKWACASCLKGHRVSGCTHTERDLTFVPKKGRPTTQCHHCRSERKKRSAHVKCDCGEKPQPKEKCVHLREADVKAAASATSGDSTPPTANNNTTTDSTEPFALTSDLFQLPEEDEDHHCCCPHGGECGCASLKKESPEDSSDTKPKVTHARPKPRLTSHQSEGHLTIFANGHHKPVHRNNNAAHESGFPYKLPRSHTAHGAANIARRSVDNLASLKTVSTAKRSTTTPTPTNHIAIPRDSSITKSERGSPHSDYSTSYQPVFNVPGMSRMSVDATSYPMSEISSSVPTTTYQDFGYPSTQSGLSINTISTEPAMSTYSLPTSGLEVGTDYWSNFDWDTVESNNTIEPQPALTNASSVTISEIDDPPRVDDLSGFDAQYLIDGQAQLSRMDYGGDYCDTSNYNGNFDMNTNSSNRYSMPTFDGQSNNAGFIPLTAERQAKNLPNQAFMMSQQAMQNQNAMSSGQTSAQSQSPVPLGSDSMYQTNDTDQPSYNWDDLLPTYNTSGVVASNDGMDESLNFAVNGSGQNMDMSGQAPQMQNNGTGSYDVFDNGYRTMQWDDGVTMPVPVQGPADQEYINTLNFDPSWSMSSFNNPWS